jgi:hypothetical protein
VRVCLHRDHGLGHALATTHSREQPGNQKQLSEITSALAGRGVCVRTASRRTPAAIPRWKQQDQLAVNTGPRRFAREEARDLAANEPNAVRRPQDVTAETQASGCPGFRSVQKPRMPTVPLRTFSVAQRGGWDEYYTNIGCPRQDAKGDTTC